jgi:hypothetical protein
LNKISSFTEDRFGKMAEEHPETDQDDNQMALDERTFLAYRKNQFKLLEKLLNSSYFL